MTYLSKRTLTPFLKKEFSFKNYIQSPGRFTLYIWSHRTRCFIPLYMYIRISAGCISNLILSVGASACSVKSFSGDSVRPSARVSYIFPSSSLPRPLGKIYSTRERESERETDTERKKVSRAARGVHAELFKWAALGGARNSVKFRAKREKSRGRIGLREF